jgi:hypothetical protein
VYLKLQINANISDRTVTLKRDTVELWTRNIEATEISITDTNLLPGHTYIYTAKLLSPPPIWMGNSTSQVQVRTMDTTSHYFTWQTFTLGNGAGSSALYDVAIVNEDPPLIYAVGQIYRNDTTFNAAKWDGQEWELMKIQFLYFCDQSDTFPFSAKAVWAFSESDIWIASGSQIVRWNGQTQTTPACIPVSVNKMWGENSNSMYAVGYGGGIAHYSSGTWTKIESGTDVELLDVYGTPDGKEVWTCGWNSSTGEGIILRKENSGWETIWHSTQTTPSFYDGELLGSLWTDGQREYWITGSGDVFRHSITNNNVLKHEAVSLGNYAYRIRGTAKNDVMLAGDAEMVWHWNGVTWYKYNDLYNINDRLYSLAVSSQIVIAVGRTYSTFPGPAFISIGRR